MSVSKLIEMKRKTMLFWIEKMPQFENDKQFTFCNENVDWLKVKCKNIFRFYSVQFIWMTMHVFF